MTTSTAISPTRNASRYLQQVCKHWSHRFEARFDESSGRVDFGDSEVSFHADAQELQSVVNGPAEQMDDLERVVEEHLNRFAHREGKLSFAWKRS